MKDPAFLFYYDKFISGTFTMTDEQVGKYIRLLCVQANKGFITEKDMNNICKTYDEDIANKFITLEPGKLHNVRLAEIMAERRAYTESRRNNRLGQKNQQKPPIDTPMNDLSKSYDNHMVSTVINKDEVTNTGDKGVGEGEKKTRRKKEVEDDIPIAIFRETELFNIEVFKEKFAGTDYELANLDYYYETILNWSDKRSEKNDLGKPVKRSVIGWVATARNFMLRDKQDNKLQLNDATTESNHTGTGKRTYTEDQFD